MEFIFVSNMDEVIAAAIMLDAEQVDGIVNASEETIPEAQVPPPSTPTGFGPDLATDAKAKVRSPRRVAANRRTLHS
jgi:hypothetical protein